MRDDDFERLYAEHAEPLLGFLVYRTRDRVLAEDIVADTFARALRARRRFDRRRGKEKTWLYSIALNILRDHIRRAKIQARALERTGATEAGPEEHTAVEARDGVTRAMAVLTEEEREAIALRFGADLTVPEIAALLGEKLTTVEGRVYRGLRKLREEMN